MRLACTKPPTGTTSKIAERLAALDRMTVSELRLEYAEVFGEETKSSNRQWLFRRIAWQVQLIAEGVFAREAIERARALAKEIARDTDLRTRPPKSPRPAAQEEPTITMRVPTRRDDRVPPPGAVLVRRFKGHDYRVTVMPVGFEYDGGHYRSLSAVAHAITGSHWNGMFFFGLANRRKEAAIA
jgi:hypothetical protein